MRLQAQVYPDLAAAYYFLLVSFVFLLFLFLVIIVDGKKATNRKKCYPTASNSAFPFAPFPLTEIMYLPLQRHDKRSGSNQNAAYQRLWRKFFVEENESENKRQNYAQFVNRNNL